MEAKSSSRTTINPPVFFVATALIAIIVLFSIAFQTQAQAFFSAVQSWIVTDASWFYVLTVALILVSVVFLAISRFGDIKLGPEHSQPDYRNASWFAMLFSAGMGIGLMFFGVAEPLMHFATPPVGDGGTVQAAREAMQLTFFHWGLHAWAIYAIVALTLAYFSYRHGLPLSLRSALYPLIGDRIYGPVGHAVDIFAVLGTVFGIATTLGYGVLQINSGFNHLFGLPISAPIQVGLIAATCGLATISVASGLNKGIRILSEMNLSLALLLMMFVLLVGPTSFLLQTFVQNTGLYLSEIVSKTFNLYAYEPTDWLGGWTLLYWGWWLSWSPFVGLFIARISRGRTIREFILGALLVPAAFTLLWMTVFGDTAIHMVLYQNLGSLIDTVTADSSLALFAMLEQLPWSSLLSMIAVTMVIIFFVTSADSGALVLDMLSSRSHELGTSPVWQRLFWSTLIGVVAAALLMADGLQALQTATIASALPFSLVLLVAMWGLFKALRLDAAKREFHQLPSSGGGTSADQGEWQRRLRNLGTLPQSSQVQRFINEVAAPACNDVCKELQKQGLQASVSREAGSVSLDVSHGAEADFHYEVRPHCLEQPNFALQDGDKDSAEICEYFRAEVHLAEGGLDYDIMGWPREDVITDIIDQYERHLQYLHLIR